MNIFKVTSVSDKILSGLQRLLIQLSDDTKPFDKNQLAQLVKSETTTVFVAADDEYEHYVLGTLTLVHYHTPSGLHVWLEDMIVDASMRGRGIGKALCNEAVKLGRELGADHIDLTSRHSRHAAIALYESIGFMKRESNIFRLKLT